MLARRLGALLLPVAITACTVGPDYERPAVVVPTKWRDPAAAAQGPALANVAWWDLFKDEQLKKLIRIALEENRDLRIAVERIEEMRANLGIAKADFYPKVDAQHPRRRHQPERRQPHAYARRQRLQRHRALRRDPRRLVGNRLLRAHPAGDPRPSGALLAR